MAIIVHVPESMPPSDIAQLDATIFAEMDRVRRTSLLSGIAYGLVAGFILGAVVIRVLL